jgi:endoglycosylceramidase
MAGKEQEEMSRSAGRAPIAGLLCALLAASLLAAGTGARARDVPSAAAAPLALLGHAGRWITDGQGRVVILHGFNLVAKSAPYYPASIGYDEDDAAVLQDEGFNVMRLGVIYAALEPSPGRIDRSYLERIAETVGVNAAHGIYSLLDLHQDSWSEQFGGEGFPGWATQTFALPDPALGFANGHPGRRRLDHAWDNFWANRPAADRVGLQDHFARALGRLAVRFVAERSVLGYDILNEPSPGSYPSCGAPAGCPRFDGRWLTPFTRRVLAAVRRADPSHLVWYEPLVAFSLGAGTAVTAGDAQAGMSFHDYCADCAAGEQTVLHNADVQAQSTGDALLNSEWGATGALETLARVADAEDADRMSWANWTYFNALPRKISTAPRDAQGIIRDPAKPPSAGNLREDKLAVLARPFPHAIAGTPLRFAFAPANRTFTLDYSTLRASGGEFPPGSLTEIFLPARQYPDGYTVAMVGAHVASASGARLLEIASDAGARTVTVRVTPAQQRTRRQCRHKARVSCGSDTRRTSPLRAFRQSRRGACS